MIFWLSPSANVATMKNRMPEKCCPWINSCNITFLKCEERCHLCETNTQEKLEQKNYQKDHFVTGVSHYTAQVELNSQSVYSDSDLTDWHHNSQLYITEGGDLDDGKTQNNVINLWNLLWTLSQKWFISIFIDYILNYWQGWEFGDYKRMLVYYPMGQSNRYMQVYMQLLFRFIFNVA